MWEFKKAILKTSTSDGYAITLCYDATCAYSACTGCAVPVRSVVKSKNVLIVYDLNSVGVNRYTNDVAPSTIATTITNRETALTFSSTTITSYTAFEALSDATIATYSHIWDIGYDTLITSAVAIRYKTYLSGGGAMFLLGENGSFIQRDNSVSSFIHEVGGGTISATTTGFGSITANVATEFLISNQTNTVTFNAPGSYTNFGNGVVLASSGANTFGAVWKTGSLTGATTAAIVSVLDVNFLVGGSIQTPFIDNLSLILNTQ